ncbi:unnamed protein product [Pleuronectes platessa]|uniref:Uncharacterized protein n=1 Tax=Pleuronectes platessa TaxID=8262 RepID=A0A9N7VXW6_PLEPL|nr:unnamed protein product [Pleuronectes platessa]
MRPDGAAGGDSSFRGHVLQGPHPPGATSSRGPHPPGGHIHQGPHPPGARTTPPPRFPFTSDGPAQKSQQRLRHSEAATEFRGHILRHPPGARSFRSPILQGSDPPGATSSRGLSLCLLIRHSTVFSEQAGGGEEPSREPPPPRVSAGYRSTQLIGDFRLL